MSCENCEESAYVIDKLAKLLAEIAVIVNGPEPPLTSWSYHDLPEKVRALKQAPPVEWLERWIRNNYQNHCNIAGLCDAMSEAAYGITKEQAPPAAVDGRAEITRAWDAGYKAGVEWAVHQVPVPGSEPKAPPTSVSEGTAAVPKGWSGWATQYPGKMPKLYGAEEIARLNWCPQEGADLVRVVEVDRVKASDWAAALAANKENNDG